MRNAQFSTMRWHSLRIAGCESGMGVSDVEVIEKGSVRRTKAVATD